VLEDNARTRKPPSLTLDERVFDRVRSWLDRTADPTAVLLRFLLGASPTDEPVAKGVALLQDRPPRWDLSDGSIDMTHWFFGSLAAHRAGGEAWNRWSKALQAAVLPNQRRDGDACGYLGSWDPVDPRSADGGRVASTALVALALETAHRCYPPR
jgi:hypothetical protein